VRPLPQNIDLDGDLLQVRDLALEFDLHGHQVPVLHGVNFRVRPGSTVALVGESGSGKSVTAQAILGILPNSARVTRGEILLDQPGKEEPIDLLRLPPDGERMRAIRGGRISMIFQEPMVSLSPLHTVGDQVSEALFLHRDVGKREGMEITKEMLRLVEFPEPERALNMYPFELSGGLRQRAMIAMALICRPALLIADEPTTALDVTIQAQILKLVRDLQHELGMAVLVITHDLGVVANLAEEVVVMYHGRIMESGPIGEIFEDPQHPYLQALLKAVPHFDMQEGERLVPVREIESRPAQMLAAQGKWPSGAEGRVTHLKVEDLTKSFTIRKAGLLGTRAAATRTAVDHVTFTIKQGECFGLVGESGCGKTTLSKLLMRGLDADGGRVTYNDRGTELDVLALQGEELKAFRRKMQFIFQDPFSSLSPRMSIFDILREPLVIHGIGDNGHHAEMAKELMRLVGLDPRFLGRYPHSFSGGQRQRIGIARALALRPDLLICDEPVSALDVSIQAQILNLLKDLQGELGLTYLFISHNLAVIHYIADRIAVMCAGRLVEVAPRDALFDRPTHPYTQALLQAVPFPDLDRLLDFEHLEATRASDPASWPRPFAVPEGESAMMLELSPGHHVRVESGTAIKEVA